MTVDHTKKKKKKRNLLWTMSQYSISTVGMYGYKVSEYCIRKYKHHDVVQCEILHTDKAPKRCSLCSLSRTLRTISLSIPYHDNTQTLPGKIYFAHMDMAGCKELLPMHILGNVVGGMVVFHELTVMLNLLI